MKKMCWILILGLVLVLGLAMGTAWAEEPVLCTPQPDPNAAGTGYPAYGGPGANFGLKWNWHPYVKPGESAGELWVIAVDALDEKGEPVTSEEALAAAKASKGSVLKWHGDISFGNTGLASGPRHFFGHVKDIYVYLGFSNVWPKGSLKGLDIPVGSEKCIPLGAPALEATPMPTPTPAPAIPVTGGVDWAIIGLVIIALILAASVPGVALARRRR